MRKEKEKQKQNKNKMQKAHAAMCANNCMYGSGEQTKGGGG